jgi:hypothetical protein
LPSWRSIEAAHNVVWSLYLALSACILFALWRSALLPGDILAAVIINILVILTLCGAYGPLVKWVLIPFLSQTLFVSRVSVWLTPTAIAFRSCIYAEPVVVWRRWKGLPIVLRFEPTTDDEARDWHQEIRELPRAKVARHLEEAMVLNLILGTSTNRWQVGTGEEGGFQRSIPLLEIDKRRCTNFVVVLKAAVALTAARQLDLRTGVLGKDIDHSAT